MQNDKVSIKKNFIFNTILTVSNMVFQMIAFPYVTRILGPEGTGKVSFATSIVYYFNSFAQLGIPTYGVRAVAQARDDKGALSKLVNELLLLNSILSLGVYCILTICLFAVPQFAEERLLICIISISIFLNAIGIEWFYRGLEKYEYITKRSVVFKFVALIATFALVKSRADYIIYGAITILASSASSIFNFFHSRKYIGNSKNYKLNMKRHLKAVGIFFAMSVATTIYLNLDTVMLGFITSNIEVGYYDAAIKIRRVLLAVVTSLGTVILPRASYYVNKNMMREFYSVSKKALEFIIMLSIGVVCYFSIFAYDTVVFLSGKEYYNAVIPMKIITPTILLAGITNILGIQMLIPLGKEKVVLYSEAAGGVADMMLNAVLIPRYASKGAAFGTLFAEIIVFLVQAIYLYKYYKFQLLEKYMLKIILAVIPSSIVCNFIFNLYNAATIWRLGLSAMIFFVLYAVSLWLIRESLFREIVFQYLDKFGRKTGT